MAIPNGYHVALTHRDRNGALTGTYGSVLVDLESGEVRNVPNEADGTVTMRLDAGGHLLRSVVRSPSTGETSLLVQPVLDPAADRHIDVDARLARPVVARPERASAVSAQAAVVVAQETGGAGYVDMVPGFRGLSTARIGPSRAAPVFTSAVVADFTQPGPDGDFTDSPYVYHLTWVHHGTLPTGFRRTVADHELATVIASHAAAPPARLSVEVSFDDKTWLPVRLTRTAHGWTAHLHHPAGAGFVSLQRRVQTLSNGLQARRRTAPKRLAVAGQLGAGNISGARDRAVR
ncbi:hypothetical protein [Actinoplanes couchii]|nr:hypothetical protein [Actinoplanes couchii]MDR6317749.1 hypothetical protein [Actinoplanes couchii]